MQQKNIKIAPVTRRKILHFFFFCQRNGITTKLITNNKGMDLIYDSV